MADSTARERRLADADRLGMSWWVDQLARIVVFVGGISAIVLIIAIFVFVASQGLGFALTKLDVGEFSTSPAWRPTSDSNPTYGALALMAGTASVTGCAMLVAVPFSLGAAIFIAEFATGKTRETLKVLVELLAAIPSVVWGFIGLTIMNPLIIQTLRRARRPQRAQRRRHPGADGGADHDLHRRGRPQGGAGPLPGSRRGDGGDALADDLQGRAAGRQATACWARCCSASGAGSARPWPS